MPRQKRFLSLLLCGILLFSLCSPPAFAQVQGGGQVPGASGWENQPGIAECICTRPCAEGAILADCPVCGAENAGLSACEGQKPLEGAVSAGSVQAMINALPDENAITGGNADQVRAQLEAIDEAKARLSEEAIGQLDISRYKAAAAALAKLAGLAGNALPAASGILIIAGQDVPETNEDVLGNGAVAYDKDTYLLTLNNCSLPDEDIIFSGEPDATLTIRLIGENAFRNISIRSDGSSLNISGTGSLRVGDNEPNASSGIYCASGNIVISGGATVAAFSNGEDGGSGIYTSATLEIIGSTVDASGYTAGLNIGGDVIIREGSKVTAVSDYSHGIYVQQGNVEISGSEVTATSATSCGIWSFTGRIQIDGSKVAAQGNFPGLNGNAGVIITQGSEVNAGSGNDCGVYSPTAIEISDSTVTARIDNAAAIFTNGSLTISGAAVSAQGHYPALRGDTGVLIQNGSEVTAASSDDYAIFSSAGDIDISDSKVTATSETNAGICSGQESITISGSELTAEGYDAGLKQDGTNGAIRITGSKVTATATIPIEEGDGSGIYTQGSFAADASEVYAEGGFLGIYIGEAGTASNAWIRAENGISMGGGDSGAYQPVNSVTIQSGNWWVEGEAKIPAGALVKTGDQIRIPPNASLFLEEGEITIFGEANGITIDGEGAMLLPAGTVIQQKDNTQLIIGADGGKISLAGQVSTTYSVTLHANGGAIAQGKEITGYPYGTGAPLPAAGDMVYAGFRFSGWYEDPGFSGSPVTAITATDIGDKDYYAKWDREATPIIPGGTVRYIVEHYKGGAGGYMLAETEYATGQVGTTVSAAPKSYEGYTYNAGKSIASGELKAITSAGDVVILKLYYDKEPETPADKENKTELGALSKVPEGLKNTPFNTVEKIIGELVRQVAVEAGYTAENFAAYDVQLLISLDGGGTWQPATEQDFPAEGITVTLPYPEGTGRDTHDFAVTHMFTLTSSRLGTTAGETEQPPVEKTAEGLKVTFHGLSPVGIAWKAVAQGEKPGITPAGSGSDGSAEDDTDEEYRFWQQVKRQIEGAPEDATLRINARGYRRMSQSVMKALRSRADVSLVIRWDGGKPITIPAGKALWEAGRAHYPLSYLESYDFGLSAAGDTDYADKTNPGTGAPEAARRIG